MGLPGEQILPGVRGYQGLRCCLSHALEKAQTSHEEAEPG